MARARRIWLLLHRWIGLTAGVLLLWAGLTGALLVGARPLDAALHPEMLRVAPGPAAPLAPVVARLRQEFGGAAAFTLRPPREAGQPLQVLVSGPWTGTVYADPASGRELGRRAAGEGFASVLFELHASLAAGHTGRMLLALASAAFLVMLITGIVLWWPARWRQAFAVRRRYGTTLLLLDLHRVSGVLLGLWVLVVVASGAYLAWRPLAAWVTALSGEASERPPVRKEGAPGEGYATIDIAVARALARWPGAVVGAVHVAPGELGASRLRLRLADDPHPVGMTSVWFAPRTAEVLAAQPWSRLDPGNRAFAWIYPLHSGELSGAGTLVLTLVAGIALAGYGATGLWLWQKRRMR